MRYPALKMWKPTFPSTRKRHYKFCKKLCLENAALKGISGHTGSPQESPGPGCWCIWALQGAAVALFTLPPALHWVFPNHLLLSPNIQIASVAESLLLCSQGIACGLLSNHLSHIVTCICGSALGGSEFAINGWLCLLHCLPLAPQTVSGAQWTLQDLYLLSNLLLQLFSDQSSLRAE